EGEPELLAGAVPLLRGGRPAADEQRAGAAVRQLPPPRAADQRAQGGVAGVGVTGLGADHRRGGDAAAARPGQGLDGRRPGQLGGAAGHVGGAPTTADRTSALPPRPGRLLAAAGSQTPPAEFADVVFLRARGVGGTGCRGASWTRGPLNVKR